MLMRTDPFRELDRLAQAALGSAGTLAGMPMDAYRDGDHVVVHVDLPGVDPASIDLTVERDVLTISAERSWEPSEDQHVVVRERPTGRSSRQLFLGQGLDAEGVEAGYDAGVLTVRIPVAEAAKPRRIEIGSGGRRPEAIDATASSAA